MLTLSSIRLRVSSSVDRSAGVPYLDDDLVGWMYQNEHKMDPLCYSDDSGNVK